MTPERIGAELRHGIVSETGAGGLLLQQGHVFRVGWSPFEHAPRDQPWPPKQVPALPVANHWAVVKRVNWADLTEEERRAIEQQRDGRRGDRSLAWASVPE
jgi:hypothetical protein